ncbi:exodeoxyribonuclease V subunit gamma [Propioniciclava coleopterorum]|uniref:Exodeoxyribonuclease V subunit gamma n=1 Tax=Propioniciclava coleopterorum TaxID=2714937 RepID=A0A6G7Y8R5_9ACTN|nr:exodeoxyribonuclease V subunit gamma [Propioniciclava coleopterorum]QIK73284.1 exodeoxyribonuclease V subunit gamma [Propioniciclava coleopterorum]
MNQLRLHTSADQAALAHAFASVEADAQDPFARPLLLTAGPGVQRWLSQRVATAPRDGEGIMAGYEVHPFGALESLLGGAPAREDAWEAARLVWVILDACADAAPGLDPLRRHLDANDQRYANALRIARLLRRYAEHRPTMLTAWRDDPAAAAAGLGPDGWQPWLWHALHARIPAADPVERRAALAASLSDGTLTPPWPAAHVFAPRRLTPVRLGLVRALADALPVDVWLPVVGPETSANELALALGRRAAHWAAPWRAVADAEVAVPAPARPDTALGALQAAVAAGAPLPHPLPADDTVSLHSSHALGRQAEVLRELLTTAFADDPTLEPRDVVVLTPDPEALAPHIAALFDGALDARGTARRHPAAELRVAVPRQAGVNQVHALLLDLLALRTSRATASQLLGWAAHPFVARRFGFSPDDLDRLEDLVTAAGVRWGINGEQRAWFGVDVQQNTWQLGVQRLTLGEAFSDDTHASVGTVATVDDVSSTDTDRIGALAELVSRLSRLTRRFAGEATLTDWLAGLREALELLVEVPFEEGWQLAQVWSVLADIEERGAGTSVPLRSTDVVALLQDAWGRRRERPAFGNGTLVVAGLEDLPRVPHRLVCLVGLDERTFPRRGLGDGDDLIARDRGPLDPDPGADDRQAVLDAVLAATERLVVIYQGQSSLTPEGHPPPAGVVELIEAVGQGRVQPESLQPFAPVNFDAAAPRSFDRAAHAAASALVREPRPAPDRYAIGLLPREAPLTDLGLDQLGSLLKHPGKFLLRERAGLSLLSDESASESIPLELGYMESWQVGDTMLEGLLAGQDAEQVLMARWLSGDVPPHHLGRGALLEIQTKATSIHRRFSEAAPEDPHTTSVDLDVDGVRLSGRVVTRGGVVAQAQYGRVDARHLGLAWVRQLAVTAQTGRRTDALLAGPGGVTRLSGPPPELARGFLSDLVALAHDGTQRVLPLPPRVSEFWARVRAGHGDPLSQTPQLEKLWGYDKDQVWRTWYRAHEAPWRGEPSKGHPWAVPGEPTLLGALAVRVWGPIVKAQG